MTRARNVEKRFPVFVSALFFFPLFFKVVIALGKLDREKRIEILQLLARHQL